jgi:threonine synthase
MSNLIPWYCRKCQTQNDDIRAETCEECGEDFPSDWENTRDAVVKLSKEVSKPSRRVELETLFSGHIEAMRPLLKEWSKLK